MSVKMNFADRSKLIRRMDMLILGKCILLEEGHAIITRWFLPKLLFPLRGLDAREGL
jgi:hypothetical protein